MEDDDVEEEEDDDVEEDDEKVDNVAENEVEDDDVAEDEAEVDDVEDDEVKGEEVLMLRMMMRRRKMMMLRGMMLRSKTDPKTGTHTVCEPTQTKCTSTLLKSHFMRKFTGNAGAQKRDQHFVRACAVEMHRGRFTKAIFCKNL